MPGVETVTALNMVDSFYGPQDALLFVLAFEPEKTSVLFPGWVMPAEQREAFQRERVATLVGRSVAAKFGWKLGDRVHLRSPGYNVELELVGFLLAMGIFSKLSGCRIGGAMPTYVQVDGWTVLIIFGVALGISLASTLPSAYRASRLSIADALRFVG